MNKETDLHSFQEILKQNFIRPEYVIGTHPDRDGKLLITVNLPVTSFVYLRRKDGSLETRGPLSFDEAWQIFREHNTKHDTEPHESER